MARISTRFTELLGVDYPIVCAPMFLVSYPDLIVAACEAGAFAAFPALNFRSHEEFAAAVREIRSRTDRPFGVNLILKANDRLEADLDLILRQEVALIITSLGDPTEIIRRCQGTRTRVFSDVINQKHAAKAVAARVDGLVAVAYGAGGHGGTISPFVLGPWLQRTYGLPILAAGGISDGRGLAAALALGMDAAYMGTRFIATRESAAAEAYKQAILAANPEDILYTAEVSGIPGNYIRSSLPVATAEGGRAEGRWKEIFSAGHGVGLIDDIPTCADLVARIIEEYETVCSELPRLLERDTIPSSQLTMDDTPPEGPCWRGPA